MSESTLVSVKEQDYLDQDPPLRGQNYVCLSFISPEDIIKKKDVFMFEKFINNFSEEMNEFFNNLSQKYKDDIDLLNTMKERYEYLFDTDKIGEQFVFFTGKNSEELEKEYYRSTLI